MERAVREGDTGLHHTAKTRRCLLASGPASSQRAGPANPMVSRAGVLQPIRSESVLPWRPEPPLRFAPRLGQASHDSARPRGAIMPGSPPDFNTRSTRFSTDRVTRDRAAAPLAARRARWYRRNAGGTTACARTFACGALSTSGAAPVENIGLHRPRPLGGTVAAWAEQRSRAAVSARGTSLGTSAARATGRAAGSGARAAAAARR